MPASQYINIAFISYKREDEEWAKWLQKKLEHYKLPTEIRKQNPDLEFAKNPRHVFKDTTDLSGGILAKAIKEGLDSSKFLIVICSPRAAKSEWVCKEVQDFIDSGREEYIIPFIIDGEPYAKNPKDECFPEALKALAGERELLGININENGRESAAVKVAARVFGLKFDSLWNRFMKEEKRKRRNIVSFAVIGFFLIATVAATIYIQNVKLKEQKEEIKYGLYSSLSQQVPQLIDNGESLLAMRLLLNILCDDPTNVEAEKALRTLCDSLEVQDYPTLMNINVRDSWGAGPYCISSNGKHIITSSVEHNFLIYNISNGKLERTVCNPYSFSRWLYLTKDGKKLITVDYDKKLRIWDYPSFNLEKTLYFGEMWSMDVNINERLGHLAIHKRKLKSTDEEEYFIYDLNAGKRRKSFVIGKDLSEGYYSMNYSNDGSHLAIASSTSSQIYILETRNYTIEKTIHTNLNGINSVRYSKYNDILAVGKYDMNFRNQKNYQSCLLDIRTGQKIYEFNDTTKGHSELFFNCDGSKLILNARYGNKYIFDFDVNKKRLTQTIIPEKVGEFSDDVCFINEDNDILTYRSDGVMKVRQHRMARKRFTKLYSPEIGFIDDKRIEFLYNNWLPIAADSDKGLYLITDFVNKVVVYNSTINKKQTIKVPVEDQENQSDNVIFILDESRLIEGIALSSDNNYFAVATIDGHLFLYSIEGQVVCSYKYPSYFESMAFSPNGDYLAFSVNGTKSNQNKGTYMLNIHNKSIKQVTNKVLSTLAFSPEGKFLYSTSNNKLISWETATLAKVDMHIPYEYDFGEVVPLSDNKRFISTRDGDIGIYDKTASKMIKWFNDHGMSICVDSEEKYMAFIGEKLKIYDLKTYSLISEISIAEIKDYVVKINFSNNGSSIYLTCKTGDVYKYDFPKLEVLINKCKSLLGDWSLSETEKNRFHLAY